MRRGGGRGGSCVSFPSPEGSSSESSLAGARKGTSSKRSGNSAARRRDGSRSRHAIGVQQAGKGTQARRVAISGQACDRGATGRERRAGETGRDQRTGMRSGCNRPGKARRRWVAMIMHSFLFGGSVSGRFAAVGLRPARAPLPSRLEKDSSRSVGGSRSGVLDAQRTGHVHGVLSIGGHGHVRGRGRREARRRRCCAPPDCDTARLHWRRREPHRSPPIG